MGDETSSESETPNLSDRLLAAVVAPFAFNLALFITYGMMFRYIRGPGAFAFAFSTASLTIPVLAVSIVVPTVVGFAFGTRGFVTFLGHSFYTHNPAARDWRITLGIWVSIVGLAFLLMSPR
jgi:hypothetical protein